MPYTITHDPELDVVNLKFTGDIGDKEISEATSKCIALQKETRVLRFLVELNGWEVAATFIDIYKLVYEQYTEEEAHRLSRIAVVLPTTLSGQAAANFYETVSQNAGWNARVFAKREEAIGWLTSNVNINAFGTDSRIPPM
jgi:hypothetical protein